ncbi:MAG: hypothetical protein ACTSVD_09500 [Candidatus Thorarchaeota archaeon]|nr:MAG: hypothetical protein DRO73_08755 [Candidatus Thorarchaeota archaeon]
MSRTARQIPRALAEFGERQFRETGALAVEVLRVKASTIRKHFRRLAGIAFLVAVINRDRVRVYFFDAAARMLLGENLEADVYAKIRKTSRLITKFEKPREPTEEELRMEATEGIRSLLARSIKRVARILARSEPEFPAIFVTPKESVSAGQSFGVNVQADGTFLFEEPALRAAWVEGLALRVAFLTHLDPNRRCETISQLVGNAVALSQLKSEPRSRFQNQWLKASKDDSTLPVVRHLIEHTATYLGNGFRWLVSAIERAPRDRSLSDWLKALEAIHNSIEVSLGTGDIHTIRGLCNTLSRPARLKSAKHELPSIHLGPRAVCNVLPLGTYLGVVDGPPADGSVILAEITYSSTSGPRRLCFVLGQGERVNLFSYRLDIDDVFPKPGGVVSHGSAVLRWALQRLGVVTEFHPTYYVRLEMRENTLPPGERAVLERLSIGDPQILRNSLIGSPERVRSLLNSKHVVLLPDFNHVGIRPNYLLVGPPALVEKAVSGNTLECTVLATEDTAYAVVSAPGQWQEWLGRSCLDVRLTMYPILHIESPRRLFRHEPFPV